MLISTKEKIKKTALKIFAEKGYEATSMSEIAEGVGIKKPSLYDHFNSKDDLFFSIFLDLSKEYQTEISNARNQVKGLKTEKVLFNLFLKYISYFYNNPEISSFWHRVLVFTPRELYDKIFKLALDSDAEYQSFLKETFEKGIAKGELRKGNVEDMMLSYGCLRSGLIAFLKVSPQISMDRVRAVWEDYWFGIKAGG